MTHSHIAVIDIGKTNAKLALVDAADLSEIAVVTRPNTVLPGPPWRHFDVEGHWEFLLEALGRFHAAHGVSAISITTHGACAALLDTDGDLAAPILDYEDAGPDEMAEAYAAVRPDFGETGSPSLSGGLNIGAQLFWQLQSDPTLLERVATVVTYPQFWAHKLTGALASDVCSLGCHTDLWDPHKGQFSSLVETLGLSDKMAAPKRPGEILGPILPGIAQRTGLAPDTPVVCGIHDSNASLLPHIISNPKPFTVISTGTWVIAMSVGGDPVALDPDKDVLINVSALGDPILSARFMGGREHDLAAGRDYPTPSAGDLDQVFQDGLMLMPSLAPESGPFQGLAHHWIGTEPPAASGLRGAAVALYLALVTRHCLKDIGHKGPIIVEGPFTGNDIYLQTLAVLFETDVFVSTTATGTSQGAAMLVAPGQSGGMAGLRKIARPNADTAQKMKSYAALWTANLDA